MAKSDWCSAYAWRVTEDPAFELRCVPQQRHLARMSETLLESVPSATVFHTLP